MRVSVILYISEPVSNDIDELTDIVAEAVEEAVGESDYVLQDMGLSFEINDIL